MTTIEHNGASPGADVSRTGEGESRTGAVVMGVVIMTIGLFLLLSRMGMLAFHVSARLVWPFILLALGFARVLVPGYRRGHRRSRGSGAWLIWVGLWGLVSEFHVLGLDYASSWPLLIIGVGIGMVWRALEERQDQTAAGRR